jgi:hypothetical protein
MYWINGFWLELGLNISISSTVPPEYCYFTSSRVGGKRGIIKELSVSLQGPEDNTLLFESRFESGNLQKAVRVWVTERNFPKGWWLKWLRSVFRNHVKESGVFLWKRKVMRDDCEDNEKEWNNCDSSFPLEKKIIQTVFSTSKRN